MTHQYAMSGAGPRIELGCAFKNRVIALVPCMLHHIQVDMKPHDDTANCSCLQVTKTFSERISQYTQTVVEALAYAGTGDVLRVQQFLSLAGDHIEVEEDTLWKVCSRSDVKPLLCSVCAMGCVARISSLPWMPRMCLCHC